MKFKVSFMPKIGGQFLNAITFTDKEGRYFWYLITSEIEPPEAISTFDIFTEIRKPSVCPIEINNNTDSEIHYKVLIHGSNLTGE